MQINQAQLAVKFSFQMKRIYQLTLLLSTILVVACSQNLKVVSTGEKLEDAEPLESSALPVVPLAGGLSVEDAPPFVKAFFMHTWVEALYSRPANQNPNPTWSSPLLDSVNGRVWCTDCHISGQVDFERIPKQRVPMVDDYENDHEFMVELMQKWVQRLNSDQFGAAAKLSGRVDCVTCHATDPRG